MLFPELQNWIREKVSDRGEVLSLGLEKKYAGGVNFDAVSAGWYLRNGYPQIYSILAGGAPAWSGESVSVETALNHSVVWACNGLISESIGRLPAVLMQRTAGGKRIAYEQPMYSAMINAPNDEISAQGFTEMLTSHCLLQGGGFAKIARRSGTGVAIQLDPLMPQQVFPDRDKQKRLVYVIKSPGDPDVTYTVIPGKPQDILHIRGLGWDGIRGFSVISMGRQSIGTAIAADRNLARFYANGGRLPYILESAKSFKDEQEFQRFRSRWEEVYSEPHRAPILENGMTMKPIGTTFSDAQGVENRTFTVSEICRWFSVSPNLVGELSNSNNSISENSALNFVKMTLGKWIGRWEQDFWRCVLTPEEKSAGYYLRHNLRDLLRGDFTTRMTGYSTALQNGFLNVDEVRDEEDRDALPNDAGQVYRFQLNMQTTPGTGDPTIVEQGILNRGTGTPGTPGFAPGSAAEKSFNMWLDKELAETKREEGVSV